jgi:hypothetical protein
LKVQFEPQSKTLAPHVLKSIEKGLKQYEAGQTISQQEFMDRSFTKSLQ